MKAKRMTKAEFFRALRREVRKRHWSIDPQDGEIRCASGLCPILALLDARGLRHHEGNGHWGMAADALGLPRTIGRNVVGAADNFNRDLKSRRHGPTLQAYRRSLKQVLGLPMGREPRDE